MLKNVIPSHTIFYSQFIPILKISKISKNRQIKILALH